MAIPPDQQAHREAFGRAIAVWFRQNAWSQQTPHEFAVAAGTEGCWNSQASLMQRGRLDPKAQLWVSFAFFNRAVAEQQIPPSIKTRVRAQLKDAQPFRLDSGTVATASDFFSMFIGEAPIPKAYAVANFFTADQAKAITTQHQLVFRETAKTRMVSPADAWLELRPLLADLTKPQQDTLQEVLSGWEAWDPDQLIDCYEPVQRALARWTQRSQG